MEQLHLVEPSLHCRLLNDHWACFAAAKQVRTRNNRLHWISIPSARRENTGILFVWPEGGGLSLAHIVPHAFYSRTKWYLPYESPAFS